MTMGRTEYATHTGILKRAGRRGYTEVEFAHPGLRQAARAERGHCLMTRHEYAARRMGREQLNAYMLDLRIERRRNARRGVRWLGGRRTGRCGLDLARGFDAQRDVTRR